MKKILLLIALSVVFAFSLPTISLAAAYEVHVTINHLYIPERSGMIVAPDRPNTEFSFNISSGADGRIAVIDKNNNVVNFAVPTSIGIASSYCSVFGAGSTADVFFPYSASLAPYNVYLEIKAVASGSNSTCMADCSLVAGNLGYYASVQGSCPVFYKTTNSFAYATCPNNCGLTNQIGFPPASVHTENITPNTTTPTATFWHSPSLLTIP